jgi:hypothetical protein
LVGVHGNFLSVEKEMLYLYDIMEMSDVKRKGGQALESAKASKALRSKHF